MDLTPTSPQADSASPQLPAREFAWRWVWLALAAAISVGTIVGYLLWGKTTAEHKDAFDTAWKSSAAVLTILASFVSIDRFRLSQREHHRQLTADLFNQRHAQALLQRQLDADQAARDDAIARQITDLSAKASEQLGSDKPAVRIGGLTDLERLAQTYPQLRQIVIDRTCAYLRAPYQPATTSQHPTKHAQPAVSTQDGPRGTAQPRGDRRPTPRTRRPPHRPTDHHAPSALARSIPRTSPVLGQHQPRPP